MRIAYLVSQYPAASHTFIRREITALRAKGVKIHTFSIREPSANERVSPIDKEAFESTFYALPPKLKRLLPAHAAMLAKYPLRYAKTLGMALKHRVPGAKALVWSLAHFAEAVLLAQEMERLEIEHVHNHFANSGANVGYLATRFLELPWSLTLHGHSETDYPAGPLLPAKLEAADFAVVISYYGMSQAMRIVAPEHWNKFVIVHCGLDLSVLPSRPQVTRARPRFICVARLSPEKGQLGLLEAFAKVRARGGEAELVLVGDGPDRERIERLIADRGLTGSVQLRGRLAEPETLSEIANSDVLVLASFIEGLPVVLMEAMALGLPVVAPNITGIPELVEDGVNGLLFVPADWDGLADAMHELASDAALRARLSQANRAKIEAEFEINKAVEPLEQRFGGTRSSDAPAQTAQNGAGGTRARIPA